MKKHLACIRFRSSNGELDTSGPLNLTVLLLFSDTRFPIFCFCYGCALGWTSPLAMLQSMSTHRFNNSTTTWREHSGRLQNCSVVAGLDSQTLEGTGTDHGCLVRLVVMQTLMHRRLLRPGHHRRVGRTSLSEALGGFSESFLSSLVPPHTLAATTVSDDCSLSSCHVTTVHVCFRSWCFMAPQY